MRRIRCLLVDDSGEDMIEYALLASFLSIVAVATLYQISPALREVFARIRLALMSVQSAIF
jgi:Flp pilus assembly pilin Flp